MEAYPWYPLKTKLRIFKVLIVAEVTVVKTKQKVVTLQKVSWVNELEKASKWQNVLRMGHLPCKEFVFYQLPKAT